MVVLSAVGQAAPLEEGAGADLRFAVGAHEVLGMPRLPQRVDHLEGEAKLGVGARALGGPQCARLWGVLFQQHPWKRHPLQLRHTEAKTSGALTRPVVRGYVWMCESLSRVRPSVTPWTAAGQAPVSLGFSRQEYWSGLLFPSPPVAHTSRIMAWCPLSQLNKRSLCYTAPENYRHEIEHSGDRRHAWPGRDPGNRRPMTVFIPLIWTPHLTPCGKSGLDALYKTLDEGWCPSRNLWSCYDSGSS